MLPGAWSVLVIATGHSLASLRSGANELAQFDTIHTHMMNAPGLPIRRRGFLSAGGFLQRPCPSLFPSTWMNQAKACGAKFAGAGPGSGPAWDPMANPVPLSQKNTARPSDWPVW